MNKRGRQILWIISSISFIGIACSYFFLPDQIPIHWNANWKIDGWADRNYIFLIGLFPMFTIIMFKYLPKFDPRRDNYKKHEKAYNILEIATVVLMIMLNWITVAAALEINVNVKLILSATIGITFIIIGNYMPTLKSNYFFGIKNPWTLSDDVVWRKTHKAGGYVFAVSGVLLLMMAFLQSSILNNITFGIIILGVVGINIYSYLVFHKLNK